MARDLSEQREHVTSVAPPQSVYDVPDWVIAGWPTEDELAVEDDKPVESTKHSEQADLLVQLAKTVTGDRPDNCIATDLAIYYHPDESPVVPDLMVVLGVEPKEDRGSYATWEEGKGPVVVVELLSRSNQNKDRTTNYEIYEQRLQVPEYFWFDPLNPSELRGFRLREGRYEDITPDEQGRLWSDELKVWLGVHERWLRLYDSAGHLILTGKEEAAVERAAREAAEALAQQERAAREAAEAELARLREELARLKADEIRNSQA
jgi:Uma2 family endonuclease